MIGLPLIVGAYLLGSILWAYVVVLALHGVDVRTVGSGNAGATNVLRISGPLPALTVLVLDAGKGMAAVAAARALAVTEPLVGGAAVAVVVGHVFPLYHGFRGGKGVATALGALAILAPLPALLSLVGFVAVTAATRYVSLGSLTAAGLFPPLLYLGARLGWVASSGWLLAASVVIAIVIFCKHHDNIARLRAGTELKLGQLRGREKTTETA